MSNLPRISTFLVGDPNLNLYLRLLPRESGGGHTQSVTIHNEIVCINEVVQLVWYVCQGLNSHYFHIIGDGHQPNSRGLYTHYKDSY